MTAAPARSPGTLRARMKGRARLRGTFVKIPHPQVVEILGGTPIDFIVLDAEHAAFDIQTIDACVLAARAWALPVLVRVPTIDSPLIGAVLDMGAAGIFLPHVATVADARRGIAAALYHGGTRGLTGSARSGAYGGMPDLSTYAHAADEEVVIVAQLEDAAAIDGIDALLGVERIDGFFIGAADLSLSLANRGDGPEALPKAVTHLATAVSSANRALGAYVDRIDQLPAREAAGYSFLTAASDQAMLRAAASTISSA
ncbi:HpcH/HpaI aldolase family protein [Sphingomonas flavalba]|uniref:HpcH/HpaI aldolase family protein n=1 Tax=Sphingomonas flavalba TaxID=2559804 RepID=UPI0039DFED4F